MKINASIMGGNFHLEAIEGNVIRGCQEIRDTTEWWFHWRFRMEDLVPGESWRVEFTNGEVVGYWGPAVRFAQGPWHFLGEASRVNGACFAFTVPENCRQAEFAFSIPYDPADWQAFVAKYRDLPYVREEIFCKTAKGREVPMLRIGKENAHGRLILTARHHACETTGNYLMEGILGHLLAYDSPLIYPVLQRYEICVVPFMDLDGVMDGDQGKSRAPHDHNRDYLEEMYPTVSGVKRLMADQQDLILIDCHSPYKWHHQNDHAFMVRPSNEKVAREAAEVGRELRMLCMHADPEQCLIYDQLVDKRVQTDWSGNFLSDEETKALRQAPAPNSTGYAAQHGARLAFTIETTYFGRPGNRASQQSMRALGDLLGLALEHYLMSSED